MASPRLEGAAAEFVRWARVGRLATIGLDGRPHSLPVCPVLDGDSLLLAAEVDAQKVRNIEADSRVGIVFDDYSEDWSALRQVLVQGTARIIRDGPEWERGRGLLYEKYLQYEPIATIGEEDTVIIEIAIERVVTPGF